MANLVVHFEIHASEPARLIDFYTRLLGWTFTQFGDAPYWAIHTGDGSIGLTEPGHGINGGLTQRQGPAPEHGAPVNGGNVVVGVDGDIDEVYQKVCSWAVPLRCLSKTCKASAVSATCVTRTAMCSG